VFARPEIAHLLWLDPAAVMRGEVWRIVTFLFAPVGPVTGSGLLWTALGLWFLHTMGTALEAQWGSFRFDMFFFLGALATLGVSFGLGRSGGGSGAGGNGAPPDLPPPEPPATISGNAATVVQTALEALGTPYIWGGTADNGFDCSGLIQYAYGQHGIRLPRMSRDQARVGGEVTPLIDALRPGDILLFSARPGAGVTHVGMYVGELKFIHSSTRGVKLSRLDPQDAEGAYWLDRWVGARRVIP